MQSLRFTFLLIVALLIAVPAADAVVAVKPAADTEATVAVEKKQLSKKELRKERRMQRKAIRTQVKEAIKEWRREGASDTNTLLLVLIAILLPPLAMLIYEGGLTSRFWLSLLLTLLFYLPGLIYTLVIILGGR